MRRLTARVPAPVGAMWTVESAQAMVGRYARVSVDAFGLSATGPVVHAALVVEDRPFDVPATYLLVTVEAQ